MMREIDDAIDFLEEKGNHLVFKIYISGREFKRAKKE